MDVSHKKRLPTSRRREPRLIKAATAIFPKATISQEVAISLKKGHSLQRKGRAISGICAVTAFELTILRGNARHTGKGRRAGRDVARAACLPDVREAIERNFYVRKGAKGGVGLCRQRRRLPIQLGRAPLPNVFPKNGATRRFP